MSKQESVCIFEHFDFIYIINFVQMICWIIDNDDISGPISTINIRRRDNEWQFKSTYTPVDIYQTDFDPIWTETVETAYQKFITALIDGRKQRKRKFK